MFDSSRMFDDVARMIDEVALQPPAIEMGMARWIDYCEQAAPEHGDVWRKLRQLDFSSDAAQLTDWLEQVLSSEPPPAEINGLWFGLYNPEPADDTGEDSQATCQMYLGGSSGFDPASDSNEWVCDLPYLPAGRYSQSHVLAEIYRLVNPLEDDDVNYLGESFLCYGYLALLVANWCHGKMRATLLGNAQQRAIVIGHDNGSFHRLAVLSA